MGNKNAVIKVHYYVVNFSDGDSSDVSFQADVDNKLNELFTILSNKEINNRKWSPQNSVNNSIVLQEINQESNTCWRLNFIKVRDEAMPGKINSDGVFTEIPLEEDEYIGEDMTMLYYPDKHIIAVQRNFYSVSASKIEDFVNQMAINEDSLGNITFQFTPITDSKKMVDGNALIRSVAVSCVDLSGNGIKDAVRNDDIFGAGRVTVIYNVGTQKKSAGLMSSILDWVKPFVGDKRYTKVQVGYKEDEDSPVSVIDYVDDKLEDKISIAYSKSDPITHNKLYNAMWPKFNKLIQDRL